MPRHERPTSSEMCVAPQLRISLSPASVSSVTRDT
jgi:hypothetical protein